MITLTLVQSLIAHTSPLNPFPLNLALNVRALSKIFNNATTASLGEWPAEPYQITSDKNTSMTTIQYGERAGTDSLDDVVTNLWDTDRAFRAKGAPDDTVTPQLLINGHINVRLDSENSPHRPSVLTRGMVYKTLRILRISIAEFGPRDIAKTEIRRNWQVFTMFSMDICH